MTVLLLLLVLLLVFSNSSTKYENFTEFRNTTLEQCAKKCKMLQKCQAFSYNEKNSTCELKQNIIDKNISDKILCNKIGMIPELQLSKNQLSGHYYVSSDASLNEIKKNSTFSCPGKGLYIHNNNLFYKIDEGQNPDFIQI